jgi:putative oxidoreductase
MEQSKALVVTSWALRIIVAAILLQTLFFKFSAAKESVYIFSTLGAEPWGRIASGIFELAASALLLIPATVTLGALMATAATGSAILLHLTRLGVALTAVGDNGELFALAIVVTACSIAILFLHRQELVKLAQLARVTG